MYDFTANVKSNYLHSKVTAKILQSFYQLSLEIGDSFGLDFFGRALIVELENQELKCEKEKEYLVSYKGVEIGSFTIDILIENKVNVKLVSRDVISHQDIIQMKNQLRMSNIEVGLILNIFVEGEHKRIVFTNDMPKGNFIGKAKSTEKQTDSLS